MTHYHYEGVLCLGFEGSAVISFAHVLTSRHTHPGCWAVTPADVTVRCRLCSSRLVAEPNQTVMDVQRTGSVIAL